MSREFTINVVAKSFIIEDGIEYEINEYKNGDKVWWLNDKYHRENGPAEECFNGEKGWYKYGYLHRTDGPAVIYPNGEKKYYLDGLCYEEITSDEEWILFQIIT